MRLSLLSLLLLLTSVFVSAQQTALPTPPTQERAPERDRDQRTGENNGGLLGDILGEVERRRRDRDREENGRRDDDRRDDDRYERGKQKNKSKYGRGPGNGRGFQNGQGHLRGRSRHSRRGN